MTILAAIRNHVAAASIAVLTLPIGAGILSTPRLHAQAPAERLPEFEVASIKPNRSGPGPVQIQTNPGGRFSATNVTLQALIQFAYRLQPFQVTGGPDWINADRFDVVAKGDDSTDVLNAGQTKVSRTQMMLQALLADRFKLSVRADSRDLPMYRLVVARSDGRLGSALHPSSVDCSADRTAENVNKIPAPPAGAIPCGIRMGLGTMTMNGATLSQFATTLSGLLDRTVLDRTSLTGTYEASLRWTPDESTPGLMKKAAFVPSIDPNGPSIFTAMQEQLGLKLDPTKGPVDVLIVLSARQPVSN